MSTIVPLEEELLHKIRQLSAEKQQEVLDFATFLLSKLQPPEAQDSETRESDVVERTWGNLSLDKETLMYIAEDKELEYDISYTAKRREDFY
jgi:hypothetical protein